MSVRKEPSGRRSVEASVEVPGTPEEVWAAIASGPGVSSWFVPVEEREDGTVVAHFGPGMDSVSRRLEWDPPRRFTAESVNEVKGPGDFPNMATEWSVEALSGGACLVRVVHSLFADNDDWDKQLESVEAGWPDFFSILRLYLTHFKGMPCATVQLMGMGQDSREVVWEKVAGGLGVADAVVGDARRSPEGAPTLGGTIAKMESGGHSHQALVLLDAPALGIAHLFAMKMGGAAIASVRLFFYGPDAAKVVQAEEPVWRGWLGERVQVM